MQIVHRDLKPGNIVLDSKMHLKLIDFATCKVFNKEISQKANDLKKKLNLGRSIGLEDDTDLRNHASRHFSLVGTEEYIAPETIEDKDLSYASDLWSLGIMIYEFLCGVTPFKGRSVLETYRNIQNFKEIKFSRPNVDAVAQDLVRKLLVKEPSQRLGATNIDDLKNHEYFQGIDWDGLRVNRVPFNAIKRPNRALKTTMSNIDR